VYEVKFTNDDRGRQRYEICHQAIVLSQRPTEVGDWDDIISLLKKIKSIGLPGKDRIGKFPLYELEDEGDLVLENSEMRQLIGFITQPIWRPEILEDVQETKRWLEGLPKQGGSTRRDAKPEEKRRAAKVMSLDKSDGATASSAPRDAS
jgi:hypothetical protein